MSEKLTYEELEQRVRELELAKSKRKKIDETSKNALRHREQKYKSLFDQSNDGVFLHDFKGNIIMSNAYFIYVLINY